MKWLLVVGVLMGLFLSSPTASASEATLSVSPKVTSEAQASQVLVSQGCDYYSALVMSTISLIGTDPAAGDIWVDMSRTSSFTPGQFTGFGPLWAYTESFKWYGLPSGTPLYVRVNQQVAGGGWITSPTYQFTTIFCSKP
jgi:hypothetical protein